MFMRITTILVDLSSHLSVVTMKYNRIELVNVKMNTKMRAAMLSIMILSTSTDSGPKQVAGTSKSDSLVSFLSGYDEIQPNTIR